MTHYARITVFGMLLASLMAPGAGPARGEEGYLAMTTWTGSWQRPELTAKIALLRVSDFSTAALIDVAPMLPRLHYLPEARRLYAFNPATPQLNTVLDFGACAGGIVRALQIPRPYSIVASGDEAELFVGSMTEQQITGAGSRVGAVHTVDVATDTVTGVLPLPPGVGPIYEVVTMVFHVQRNELYVNTSGGSGINVYDASTKEYVRNSACGGGAIIDDRMVIVSTQSGALVVRVHDAFNCALIHTVVTSTPSEAFALPAVRSRAGDKVYILTSGVGCSEWGDPATLARNTVTVVDMLTYEATTIPLNRELAFMNSGMVLSADETKAYILMHGRYQGGGCGTTDPLNGPGDALGVLDLQSGLLEEYPLEYPPGGQLALIERLGFQCGDGQIDAACGEQCDPPGSVVDGQLCDVNCTMGCGNGITSGTEECDDANSSNQDACKNDCARNVCGDGIVHRGVEQCDDGNAIDDDGCDNNCHLPPESICANLPAGGTLTTDTEGDGARPSDPVETWITPPAAGEVCIDEGAPDPNDPSGYAFLGYSVHVTVADASRENPIVLVFELHSSLLPEGGNQTAVEVAKNGELVPPCSNDEEVPAQPDPCVASRDLLANGNLRLTVRSSTASYWGGVAPLHDVVVSPLMPLSITIPAGKFLPVTKTLKPKVTNADARPKTGKGDYPVRLTATSIDCPPGVLANVPDFDNRKPFAQDSVTLAAGRSASGKLPLTFSKFFFTTANAKTPQRCRVKLSAEPLIADNVDPTAGNNEFILEINVVDRNDAPQVGPEYLIRSARPKTLALSKGRDSMSRSVAYAVANTGTGEQTLTVAITETDCPPGTLTGLTLGRATGITEATATVRSGATLGGKLQVTVTAEAFDTPSKSSPARCSAVLTATGTGGDMDSSNNHTHVQLTVLDKNDL